jgi:multidrug efflux pump subunit AcrA (membrane-fusion protein)
LGQDWVVDCPFAGMKQRVKILSITSEIDKETKTLRIRTSIENTENRIKADMLVTGYVEIPPPPGHHHATIPRLAMVSADGGDYTFVLIPNAPKAEEGAMRFERRKVRVIHEGSDGVIVAESGKEAQDLKAGDQVATKGSLLLQQIYEDSATIAAGGPR